MKSLRLTFHSSIRLAFLAIAVPGLALAGPLEQAQVHRIVNDVRVVDPQKSVARPAKLEDVIKDDLAVRTGLQSRAELLFQDNTLTRLGAETLFSFKTGTRDMTLDRGTMLLQVPKGLGGARIQTGAVTAAITGTTIMLENMPGDHIKVLVLEGSLRLSINGRLGESAILTAGKMIIMGTKDKSLPKPVTVDLAKIVKTSALVDPVRFQGNSKLSVAPLPSMGLIQQEMALQNSLKQQSRLAETNLLINGQGTNVIIASKETMSALENVASLIAVQNTAVDTRVLATDATVSSVLRSAANAVVAVTPSSSPVVISTVATNTTPTPTSPPSGPATVTPPPPTLPTPPTTTPSPPPTTPPSTLDAPPSILAPTLTLTQQSKITTVPTGSSIISGGNTYSGSLYTGMTNDGPAASFLFGGDTPNYDETHYFNSNFGTQSLETFPTAGVAIFKFGSIVFSQAPTFNIGTGASTPQDLALVSVGNITDTNGPGNNLNLANLDSLMLATINGSITLNDTQFSTGPHSSLDYLWLYARGAGSSITVNSNFNLPQSSLFMDSPGTLTIGQHANLQVNEAVLNSDGAMILNGQIHANELQLYSGTSILLGQSFQPPNSKAPVSIYAPSFTSYVQLNVTGGTVQVGAGGINMNGNDFTGFSSITSGGAISARNLSATGNISATGAINISTNGNNAITAASLVAGGGIQSNGADGTSNQGPGNGGQVTLNVPQVTIDTNAINGVNLNGGNGMANGPGGGSGGNGGTLTIGSDHNPVTGDVTINAPISVNGGNAASGNPNGAQGGNGGTVNIGANNNPVQGSVNINANVSATTGANSGVSQGGTGGNVNVVSNGTIDVSATVKVSESATPKASKSPGNVSFTSNNTNIHGTAINIQNSGQILTLLNAAQPGQGGKVTFVSAGGAVNVNGKVQADGGTISIMNNGAGGAINMTNPTLSADVIKAAALGANGQLTINGGNFNASTMLALYAAGTNGTIQFTGTTYLNGQSAKYIAANTVTVSNGSKVNVSGGAAQILTNNSNYNGAGKTAIGYGTINGPATTSTSGDRLGFRVCELKRGVGKRGDEAPPPSGIWHGVA